MLIEGLQRTVSKKASLQIWNPQITSLNCKLLSFSAADFRGNMLGTKDWLPHVTKTKGTHASASQMGTSGIVEGSRTG